MKTTIISGTTGSAKTTLLLNLINNFYRECDTAPSSISVFLFTSEMDKESMKALYLKTNRVPMPDGVEVIVTTDLNDIADAIHNKDEDKIGAFIDGEMFMPFQDRPGTESTRKVLMEHIRNVAEEAGIEHLAFTHQLNSFKHN